MHTEWQCAARGGIRNRKNIPLLGCSRRNACMRKLLLLSLWRLVAASELKPLLAKIDGFVSIERFESLYEPGEILSLSFFRDEAAVKAWRNTLEHRKAQVQGRSEIFANYRLRVASVIRDYGMDVREHVPADSREVYKA